MGYITRKKGIFVTPDSQQTKGFDNISEDAYMYCYGRMFGGWIDDNSRSTGFIEGDPIENPAYIIESLLRDEIFVERDLGIDSVSGGGAGPEVEIQGLLSSIDDYYNGAYAHNITANEVCKITDYNGTAKKISVTITAPGGWSNGDNIIITNIQADNKIDYASFDIVGNASNGTRKDWSFCVSINEETSIKQILNEICDTAFLVLTKQHNKWKLFDMDEAASPNTWTLPLNQNGREVSTISPTDLDFMYNDFKLNYHYNHGRKKFTMSFFVNKSGYTTGLTNGSTLQGLCDDVYTNYRIIKPLETEYEYIQTTATAILATNYLVNWRTKQRLLVSWGTTAKDGIAYEIGDKVLLNHALIPDSLRNSAQFMITSKNMILHEGDPYIIFELIQIS